MSRETYVFRNGEMILKAKDGVLTDEYIATTNRVDSGFYIIGDGLPGGVNGMINHADGKRYDSKSQYEKAVRAKGCRIIGNDWNNKDMNRKEIYGDYNVKYDVAHATKSILGRLNGR